MQDWTLVSLRRLSVISNDDFFEEEGGGGGGGLIVARHSHLYIYIRGRFCIASDI